MANMSSPTDMESYYYLLTELRDPRYNRVCHSTPSIVTSLKKISPILSVPFFGDLKTRQCCNQGGRLALHVLALACAWILHSLHLHRLVRRTCFHEGPPTIRHQATYDCLQPLPNSAQPVAFPKGKLLLADWSLQLALSISGLFKFWRGHVGSRYDLVVLLFKAGWHHRLLFLCAAKEMEAPLYSPCFPSWYHALHFLVRYQVSDISNRN